MTPCNNLQKMKEIFLIVRNTKTIPDIIGGAFNHQIHTTSETVGFVETEKTAKKWERKPIEKAGSKHNSYEISYSYRKISRVSSTK